VYGFIHFTYRERFCRKECHYENEPVERIRVMDILVLDILLLLMMNGVDAGMSPL
jgi:hypothetical protein